MIPKSETTRDRWVAFMAELGFAGPTLAQDAVKAAMPFAESELRRALNEVIGNWSEDKPGHMLARIVELRDAGRAQQPAVPSETQEDSIVFRPGKTCCYFHATGGSNRAKCGADDASISERGEQAHPSTPSAELAEAEKWLRSEWVGQTMARLIAAELDRLRKALGTQEAMTKGCQHHLLAIAKSLGPDAGKLDDEDADNSTSARVERELALLRDFVAKVRAVSDDPSFAAVGARVCAILRELDKAGGKSST